MPRSDSDAVAQRPTVQEEMAKFQGFSTTDGEVSAGDQTAHEAEVIAANAKAAKGEHAANSQATEHKQAPVDKLSDKESADVLTAAQAAAGDEELTDEQKDKALADALAKKQAAAGKPKKTVDARIGEITKARRAAERERDEERGQRMALERRIAALEGGNLTQQPGKGKTPASNPDKEPDAKDFEYGELDPAYVRAVSRYEARQELKAAQENAAKTSKQTAEQKAAAELKDKMDAQFEKGVGEYDDFEEVVMQGAEDDAWALTEHVAQLAAESEVGHHVLYHLASNPKEAARIAGLSPLGQAAAFGRLEAKFSSGSQDANNGQHEQQVAATKTPVVKTSKAPPPVKPARGAGGNSQVAGDTTDFKAFESLAMARRTK